MKSPLASLPFFVKLPICIFFDLLSFGIGGFTIGSFLSLIGVSVLPLGITAGVVYGLLEGLIMLLFYSFSFFIPITIFESIPAINMFPLLTIVCLWNGYKTGWRL